MRLAIKCYKIIIRDVLLYKCHFIVSDAVLIVFQWYFGLRSGVEIIKIAHMN